LRKRLPIRHSFFPTKIGRQKPAGSNAFADLFFRKCAQTICAPIDMDRRHSGVLITAAAKVNRAWGY
jgi:hypothetical protein